MQFLENQFQGWIVDEKNGVILDNDGNHYYLNEIRSIHFLRGLPDSLMGSDTQILALKQILEKRIKEYANLIQSGCPYKNSRNSGIEG